MRYGPAAWTLPCTVCSGVNALYAPQLNTSVALRATIRPSADTPVRNVMTAGCRGFPASNSSV